MSGVIGLSPPGSGATLGPRVPAGVGGVRPSAPVSLLVDGKIILAKSTSLGTTANVSSIVPLNPTTVAVGDLDGTTLTKPRMTGLSICVGRKNTGFTISTASVVVAPPWM